MRYVFPVRDTVGLIPDWEGSELPDLVAARHEARLGARDFAIENLRSGLPPAGSRSPTKRDVCCTHVPSAT